MKKLTHINQCEDLKKITLLKVPAEEPLLIKATSCLEQVRQFCSKFGDLSCSNFCHFCDQKVTCDLRGWYQVLYTLNSTQTNCHSHLITEVKQTKRPNDTGMRKATPGSSVSSWHDSNHGTIARAELNVVPSVIDGVTGPE